MSKVALVHYRKIERPRDIHLEWLFFCPFEKEMNFHLNRRIEVESDLDFKIQREQRIWYENDVINILYIEFGE